MAQHDMPGQAVRGWPRRVAAAAVAAAAVVAAALAGAGPAVAKPKPPALAFTPSSYDYMQVTTGQTASKTFTLANTGKRASGTLRLRLAGAAAFSITGNTCSRKGLRPGKSCTVRVRFAPTSSGTVTATLTAAGKKPAATATAALTGTGASLGAVPGHLYWANSGSGTINVANPDGSSPRVLVSGQSGAEALAVDASHIYWTNTSNGTISEANTDGSNPHVIVSGHLSDGVAVDASHLYWTAIGEGTVYEANLDGTNPQAIVSGQSGPWGVAVDASQLYWTNPVAGTIWAANLDGSSPHVLLALQDNPAGVAVGGIPGPLLYWANTDGGSNGTINRANLNGTSSSAIVGGQQPRLTWRSAPAACTGPTPTAARSTRPTSTAATRMPSSPTRTARSGWQSARSG